jgi:hypothetical protein
MITPIILIPLHLVYATWHNHDSATSPSLCHMASHQRATSAVGNQIISAKKGVLNLATNQVLSSQLN